jgi:protein TonB
MSHRHLNPAQTPQIVRLSTGVLTGKALNKPSPTYPQIAKAANVQGPVSVQVMIDEQGHVISAKATSGNPLLLQAAQQTALRWTFTPTLLSGQPVKVTGVVTFNFVLNR